MARYTVAQALIRFLDVQYVKRDSDEHKFFEGCFGIFGHGNVAGIGQALQEYKNFRYIPSRNEQAMVHSAVGFAKARNRLCTFACTSSIGPGATNMVTGAAVATINSIPVLLLPGDIFANRRVSPVLQQLEDQRSADISVNDCLIPVSKYWDRINRPEQLIDSLMRAMQVLTSPINTGAVTLALPQDVQAEAYDYPEELFEKRIWTIARPRPDESLIRKASESIKRSVKPVIIAGGGVIYSEACGALERLCENTGIPVTETFSGKGALSYDNPNNLGAVGVTGTFGSVQICNQADLVIGIGSRYSDFTTASRTLLQNPEVSIININISETDSHKLSAIPVVGDAKVAIEELIEHLEDYRVSKEYHDKVVGLHRSWDTRVEATYAQENIPMSQAEIIGLVNERSDPGDVVVCASGSMPGELHKLWRARHPKNFHLEYGYSCMGYEIAGGLGVKLASPDKDVYVMIGDGSYLMMSQEIITTIQENQKLIIILVDNEGFASIGSLSRSIGSKGFGTRHLKRDEKSGTIGDDRINSDLFEAHRLPVDLAMNAQSLGAQVIVASDKPSFSSALKFAKTAKSTCVIYVKADRYKSVDQYAWWEVPIAEISDDDEVNRAKNKSDFEKKSQKWHLQER